MCFAWRATTLAQYVSYFWDTLSLFHASENGGLKWTGCCPHEATYRLIRLLLLFELYQPLQHGACQQAQSHYRSMWSRLRHRSLERADFSKTNTNTAVWRANQSHSCRQFSLIRNNCAGPRSNKGRSRAGFVLCVIRRVKVSLGMNEDIFTSWQRPSIRKLCRHSENKLLCHANKTNTWIFTVYYWTFQIKSRVRGCSSFL